MKKKDPTWYRHLAAPGVEFRWRLAKGAPKKFELVIRSMADASLEVVREVPDMNATPVTFFLQEAMTAFARQIEQRILNDRKRRSDQIAAREIAEDRAISERAERESGRQAEGHVVENDKVPPNSDKQPSGTRGSGGEKSNRAGGKRGQGQPEVSGVDVTALY